MEASRNKLPIRRDAIGLLALGSTVLALAAVRFGAHAEDYARDAYSAVRTGLSRSDSQASHHVHYTSSQLANMPGQRVKAQAGDGFDNLSVRVNPNADISSTGARIDLRHYLQDQQNARNGHAVLQPGDALCVPRVPHEMPEPPIPPSARC